VLWTTGSGTADMVLWHWVGFDSAGSPDVDVAGGTIVSGSLIEQVDVVCTGTKVCAVYSDTTDLRLAIATVSPFAVDSDSVVEAAVTATRTAIGLQDATQGFVAYTQERTNCRPSISNRCPL